MGVIFYSILYGTLPFGRDKIQIGLGNAKEHLDQIKKLQVPEKEEDKGSSLKQII